MPDDRAFSSLEAFLLRVPAIRGPIARGHFPDGRWWTQFSIDISDPLAWNVVQEFGHVLNLLSLAERLPTTFKPVSPPPYLNGGPADFLSWSIESADSNFKPGTCAKWLEARLPKPVGDRAAWRDEGEASRSIERP